MPDGLADYSMIEREVAVEQSRDKRTTDGMKHRKQKFHRVQILDPATGTGTFLAEVVNQIYDRYRDNQGIWQQYVEQHLLPRLNGFEILMASYAVAHIKLDMLLAETGYQHTSDKRLHVYLTNSLEESNNEQRTFFAQCLSQEANAANTIKRDYPVMVMIGNPPYSVSSQNNGKWITNLVADYKKNLNERNIQPLSDDYIKFIRLAQYYIEQNKEGVLAFISNNSFVDGIIHRQMRRELLRAFDKIYIFDLHGNSRKKETAPDGSKDENVFDIMQGVSINIFVKTSHDDKKDAELFHFDILGTREEKYSFLNKHSLQSVSWQQLTPQAPQYFFVPKDFALQEEYEKGFPIDQLMPIYSSGVKTSNDEELVSDIEYYSNNERVYFYRPFDIKHIDYDLKKVGRPRYNVMKHLEKENLGILACKQAVTEKYGYFVTKGITDINYTGTAGKFGAGLVFPLYIYKDNMGEEERMVNFDKKLYDEIAKGMNYLPCYDDDIRIDPTSDCKGVLYPQDLLDYIYAVLHSPSYRERYKEFLKIDFPRIPYPKDWEKFRDLAELGEELRHLHLMEYLPSKLSVTFPKPGSAQVDCYRWEQNKVYINDEQYFDGVPESAWNFYIGGYQPAQKWLKDRKGRILGVDDVKHYQQIIYILQETERIMNEIDEIIK